MILNLRNSLQWRKVFNISRNSNIFFFNQFYHHYEGAWLTSWSFRTMWDANPKVLEIPKGGWLAARSIRDQLWSPLMTANPERKRFYNWCNFVIRRTRTPLLTRDSHTRFPSLSLSFAVWPDVVSSPVRVDLSPVDWDFVSWWKYPTTLFYIYVNLLNIIKYILRQ